MMGFLKSFFSGEKTAEEQALAASMPKKHDVLELKGFEMGEDEEEKPSGGCGSGCGGCGCR